MTIQEILGRNCIFPSLRATNKEGVIRELAEAMAAANAEINADELTSILLERERLGSTGIGSGVAIPHGKLANLSNIITGFGRSINGTPFDAQDGGPVHLFFVLIAPKDSASLHLKAMARLSRLIKDPNFRKRLIDAKDSEEIFNAIVTEDEKF